MPNYTRIKNGGRTYFFTVVTYNRRPIFDSPIIARQLRSSIIKTRHSYPFVIDAWVLLPDHIHCIWTLPGNDRDYSRRWGIIKTGFTKNVRHLVPELEISESRKKKHEGSVWQRRFWEHEIRDEADFVNHVEYIHYNPVKHGLVKYVKDWPYSTFHRYVKEGVYPEDWGGGCFDDESHGYGE